MAIAHSETSVLLTDQLLIRTHRTQGVYFSGLLWRVQLKLSQMEEMYRTGYVGPCFHAFSRCILLGPQVFTHLRLSKPWCLGFLWRSLHGHEWLRYNWLINLWAIGDWTQSPAPPLSPEVWEEESANILIPRLVLLAASHPASSSLTHFPKVTWLT